MIGELGGLFAHTLLQDLVLGVAFFGGVFSDVLGDFHRAEVRAAHTAEVRGLRAVSREGFVVEFPRPFRVEAKVELILPAEFEPRLAQRVVAVLCAGVALGQVSGVGGNLVGDDAFLYVLFVWQAKVFLRGDVAEHRAAVPADHRGADAAGDVVVAGGDVGRQRAKCVERCLVAPLQLLGHVVVDHVHWHVAGAFVHDLHAVFPRAAGEVALHLEFGELRLVVGVSDGAGSQAVADAETHVVGSADFADVIPMRV